MTLPKPIIVRTAIPCPRKPVMLLVLFCDPLKIFSGPPPSTSQLGHTYLAPFTLIHEGSVGWTESAHCTPRFLRGLVLAGLLDVHNVLTTGTLGAQFMTLGQPAFAQLVLLPLSPSPYFHGACGVLARCARSYGAAHEIDDVLSHGVASGTPRQDWSGMATSQHSRGCTSHRNVAWDLSS